MRPPAGPPLGALALGGASGCSLKAMAVKTVADAVSESGIFARGDEPDLVRASTFSVPSSCRTAACR